MFANGAAASEPDRAAELAVEAESLGFESLWAVQHIVIPVRYGSRYPYSSKGTIAGGNDVAIPDPLIWLSYVAARTQLIRLATGVLILPQQHPLVVAKQVATLDRLSVGLGAGWLAEEFRAVGQVFARRGTRLDEGIEVLRAARLADGFFTLAVRGEQLRALTEVLQEAAAAEGRQVEVTAERTRSEPHRGKTS